MLIVTQPARSPTIGFEITILVISQLDSMCSIYSPYGSSGLACGANDGSSTAGGIGTSSVVMMAATAAGLYTANVCLAIFSPSNSKIWNAEKNALLPVAV